ncbi:ABC-type transport auxiliary lipoprotein family protein [Luteimonas sp. FXH3W]|uniref:ABC-type transport auxiliary lipoprotein family protein n=1 Tax=Aquilutibacter rugosus TaxID=3115820 RepID=A0ABU7V0A0_9GAMM
MSSKLWVSGVLSAAVLLGGCSFGGTKKPAGITQYSPRVPIVSSVSGPRKSGQLIVDTSYTTPVLDNLRIAVRPRGNELEVYKGSRWANTPAEMLTTAVIQSLEQSQAFSAVGRSGAGLNPDYRLSLEIRNFEAIYDAAGMPVATVIVVGKLVRAGDEKQVQSREFTAAVPAASADVPAVVNGFAQALSRVGAEIAGWAGR